MTLYHASKTPILDPNPFHGRKNADMGQGFYLSPDEEFSLLWAKEGWCINVYEFHNDGFKVETLEIGEKWFDTIFQNRNFAHDAYLDADVVIAPIANDTLFDLVGILTSGFVPKPVCLKVLSLEPKFTQIVLKNQKSAANLRFLESRIVTKEQAEQSRIKADKLSEEFLSKAMKVLGHYGDILS
jgi:hypothetical protein